MSDSTSSTGLGRPALIVLVLVLIGAGAWLFTSVFPPAVNRQHNPGSLRLSEQTVSDEESLTRAVSAIGLTRSKEISGYVDQRQRSGTNRVWFGGWAKDEKGGDQSLSVIIFGNGKNLALVETQGKREDVDRSAANLAFKTQVIQCPVGAPLVAVAVNQRNEYAPLLFWRMQPEC